MPNRLIFVSCGQAEPHERLTGRNICEEIDATEGFESYFADRVQDLEGLSEHILDALRRCTGAVVVLHPRGSVEVPDGRGQFVRSSVWVNQEVAILAYRQQFESRRIPILAYKAPAVALEGAMTAFIVNPRDLGSDEEVLEDLRLWLAREARSGPAEEQQAFDEKWQQTTSEQRELLKALSVEGGRDVKDTIIRQRLRRDAGLGDRAHSALLEGKSRLSARGLVRLKRNDYDGDEMSLHDTWRWYVLHKLAQPSERG